MQNESRFYEDNKVINFQLPFNKNLTIAFFTGTPLVLVLISLLVFWEDIQPEPRAINYNNTVPLTILNFGKGDGTGVSKGNLSEEGIAHKGTLPESNLHDAEVASQTKKTNTNAETDPTVSSNIKSVSSISSTDNNANKNIGNNAKNVGIVDGSLDGSGLGSRGHGMGMGEGFGEIEWGGGGNRTLLSKKPPKFPAGANISGETKIKFYVKPDGTVSRMIILRKVDPALENAALEALKQWRFNPIKDTVEMEATIPFKFRLK
jgi:TonB family protein